MSKSKKTDLHERIDFGVRREVARALAAHKSAGRSIVVWQDGQIVRIPPDEIVIDEDLLKEQA